MKGNQGQDPRRSGTSPYPMEIIACENLLTKWRGGRAWFNALGWKPSGPSKAPQVRILSSPPNGGICQQEKQPDSHSGNLGSSPSTPAIFIGSFDYLDKSSGFHPEDRGFESHRTCQCDRQIRRNSLHEGSRPSIVPNDG